MAKRVYELAKELGKPTADVVAARKKYCNFIIEYSCFTGLLSQKGASGTCGRVEKNLNKGRAKDFLPRTRACIL